MTFVSRREWGAAYPQGSGPIPGPVRGVTCHWEGPAMGYPWPHSACAGKVRTIERFHAVSRGWSGIAYNALACPHGYVFEGRGVGVRSAANGDSNIGGNDAWYAACYLAGVGDEFTAEGQAAMLEAIAWLRRDGAAGDAVNGHRDHHPTECPGDVIYRWVQAGIPPATTPVLEEDDMALDDKVNAEHTAKQVLARLDRFMDSERERSQRTLRALTGLADEVSAAVVADVRADLAAGGGIEPEQLKRIVYSQAQRAIDVRLGSLDEPKG